jgi:ABC-type nitrate/sulfonate/bicarbonate transport system substrate-binding protein
VLYKLCALLSFFFLVFGPSPVSAQLKKVRFAVGSISQAEVPFNLAKLKGFYREEGLDVDIILIRGALGVQALVGGSVDYSSSSGSVVAAGVRGLGVKLLMVISSRRNSISCHDPRSARSHSSRARRSASHRAAAPWIS